MQDSSEQTGTIKVLANGLSDVGDACANYYGRDISHRDIFAEQVKLLYAGSVYRPFIHIIPAGFIFALGNGHIETMYLAGWVALLMGINLLRFIDIRKVQPTLEHRDDFPALRDRFASYTFFMGLLYGLGTIYITYWLPELYQLVLLSLLATLTPAAIVSFASDRKSFFSFFLPVLIPVALQHVLWGNALHLFIGLAAVLYMIVIIGYFSWHRSILIDAICHRIASADHISELMISNEQLLEMASTDTLTGIASRRQFDFTLDREWRRMKRSRTSISLILLSIDYFDIYVDTYGEQAGNEMLQKIAHGIVDSCNRPLDMPVRFGQEKFAVLLPDTSMENSLVVARNIRYTIHNLEIENRKSPHEGRLTVSMGVSSSELRRTHSEPELIAYANESLGLAKRSGGNVIITAGAVMPAGQEEDDADDRLTTADHDLFEPADVTTDSHAIYDPAAEKTSSRDT